MSRPVNGKFAVCWYVTRAGKCAGRDFYEREKKSRASLMAKAQTLAATGRLLLDAGHWCDPPFEHVFAFTSKRHRYFAFKHEGTYYITNGAMKTTTERRQDADRRFCEKCRDEHLSNGRTDA